MREALRCSFGEKDKVRFMSYFNNKINPILIKIFSTQNHRSIKILIGSQDRECLSESKIEEQTLR